MAEAKTARAPRPSVPAWRSLITPEGVDLRLEIGAAGERASAFLLDLVIIVVVLVVFTLVCGAAAWAAPGEQFDELAFVVWVLGFFLLRNLYFTLWELRPRAQTPGKRILGLRVAPRDGGRLSADAVFGRNAMRELEFFLPLSFMAASAGQVDAWVNLLGFVWCGLFLFFPLFNRDRLRVGDLIAGTWVVKAPRRRLALDLAGAGGERAAAYRFSQAQLDAYGEKELHVLEGVLRTRDRGTIKAVAERIRNRIEWLDPTPDEFDFLSAYYAAIRARLESRMLFGRRKADKHHKA